MPDKDTKKENELQKTEAAPEIELADFRQYVKYSIPYNGTVRDRGKIKYDENCVLVLREIEMEEPTQKDYDWLNNFLTFTSIGSGGFSYGWQWGLEFKQYNLLGWTDAKNVYRNTSEIAKKPITKKFPRGVEGIRNSRNIARNKVVPLSKLTLVVRGVSEVASELTVALSVRDLLQAKIYGDDAKVRGAFYDIIFGCITFVSGVGFVISGVYFVTDYIVKEKTGKRIHEHAEDRFNDKMWKLQNNIIAEFNKFVNMCLPF